VFVAGGRAAGAAARAPSRRLMEPFKPTRRGRAAKHEPLSVFRDKDRVNPRSLRVLCVIQHYRPPRRACKTRASRTMHPLRRRRRAGRPRVPQAPLGCALPPPAVALRLPGVGATLRMTTPTLRMTRCSRRTRRAQRRRNSGAAANRETTRTMVARAWRRSSRGGGAAAWRSGRRRR
jgi:hypothetical protein